jgi:hypothetical protein
VCSVYSCFCGGARPLQTRRGVVRRALELLEARHVHGASAVQLGPVEVEPLAVVVSLGAELVEPDALAVWHACNDTRRPRASPASEGTAIDATVPTESSEEARFTEEEHAFLLSRVQPALIGLIDGSLSTLAPIFAVALSTEDPHIAFFAGLATAIGAAVSMAFSEGLSDTGEFTGRGSPLQRGAITGMGTFIGGVFHTLPFLINNYHVAIVVGLITVGIELVGLAVIRARFFRTGFLRSFATVTLGGAIIVAVSAALGSAA